MTTLTIKEDINLSVRNFNTYDDLVQFVLNENFSKSFKDNGKTYYSMEEARKISDKNIEISADKMIKDLMKTSK